MKPDTEGVPSLPEKATEDNQASENWALFMEICDLINEREEGPKDAIKAIRKRLNQAAGKSHKVVIYSLTVLETCVKNCGKRFHVQVAHKDFLQDLVKIIGPKNDPPQVVQEKVLSLIQTWADAFQSIPELKEVSKVYQELKHKGIEFPPTDLDKMAPIHTPAKLPGSSPPAAHAYPIHPAGAAVPVVHQTPPQHPQHHQQPAPQPAAGPLALGGDQMQKLRTELDVVQQNMKVLSDMLTELTPGQEHPSDLQLLQDLNRTCRQMQQRVVELIERIQNEDVTDELLRINDELNNVFLRYDRFERLRSGQTRGPPDGSMAAGPPAYPSGTAAPPPAYPAGPAAAGSADPPAIANLIDLETPEPRTAAPPYVAAGNLEAQLADLNLGSNTVAGTLSQINTTPATTAGAHTGVEEADFDMFAQSRTSFDQTKQNIGGENPYPNQSQGQFDAGLGSAVNARTTGAGAGGEDPTREFDEMEKWLAENPGATPQEPGATSSEFDRFLAERAREGDNLPDMNPGQNQGRTNPRGGRQMQKDDGENALFAL